MNHETIHIVGVGKWGKELGKAVKELGNNPLFIDQDGKLPTPQKTVYIFACGPDGTNQRIGELLAAKDDLSEIIILEIESVKRSIDQVLGQAHEKGADITSMHPMCSPDSDIQKISPNILMPFQAGSPSHNLAKNITEKLQMIPVENVRFRDHDNIINRGIQGPAHASAWDFLQRKFFIAPEMDLMEWFHLSPASEKLMFLGYVRIFAGDIDLSARIVGQYKEWQRKEIELTSKEWKSLITKMDPQGIHREGLLKEGKTALKSLKK